MVKGSSAKKQMVGQLYNNLLKLFEDVEGEVQVKKFSDKIEVVTPIEQVNKVKKILLNTSGIEQVLEALQFDNMETIDEIKVQVGKIVADGLEGKTFVVRTKRSGKHPFTSSDIERTVGGYVLANSKANCDKLPALLSQP